MKWLHAAFGTRYTPSIQWINFTTFTLNAVNEWWIDYISLTSLHSANQLIQSAFTPHKRSGVNCWDCIEWLPSLSFRYIASLSLLSRSIPFAIHASSTYITFMHFVFHSLLPFIKFNTFIRFRSVTSYRLHWLIIFSHSTILHSASIR